MRCTRTVAAIACFAASNVTLANLVAPARAGAADAARVVRESAASGSAFEIDGVSGTIAVTGTNDRILTVDAEATSDTGGARVADHVRVERTPGRLKVCTVFGSRRSCGSDRHDDDSNGLRVDYRVGLPEGVALEVRNVDGMVSVHDVRSTIDVSTVNGNLSIDGDRSIAAKAVNGKIDATARATSAAPCSLQTVDGSISLHLRASSDATVSVRTLNGDISGEGRIALADRSRSFVGHNATGTVGSGSGSVSLRTLNGSVRVVAD